MKSTWVDREGNVRCPKCGGKQFTSKRTGKAKWAGALTVGVGLLAMPKRLKCQGCGQNLKTGSAKDSEWNTSAKHEAAEAAAGAGPVAKAPARPPSRPRAPRSDDEARVRAESVEVGDELRWANRSGVVVGIEPTKAGNLSVQLDDGKKALGLAPMSKVRVRRP